MGDMIFVPPDESWMFAPVSGTAVDTTFEQSWLTDGAPDTPVQGTGLNLTVTPASLLSVDVVAIVNHNMQAGSTVTLGGSLSGTITTPAWGRDGLPKNWFKRYTSPVTVTTAVLTTAQLSGKSVIGEFYGGKGYTLVGFLKSQSKRDPGMPFTWEGEAGSRPAYDPLVSKPRRLSGSIAMTDAEVLLLEGWDESTHRGTRPPLLIPNADVNDAWLVNFNFTVAPSDGYNLVTIEFAEIPRNFWDS